MSQNQGGFFMPNSNNVAPGQQQGGGYPSQGAPGYPPQGASAYPPQSGFPPQQPGQYPQQPVYPQQPTGYPQQPSGYPPQPAGYPNQPAGYPQGGGGYPQGGGGYPQAGGGGYPQGGGAYPAAGGLPYGLAPNIPPTQPGGAGYDLNPLGGPGYQPQQQNPYPGQPTNLPPGGNVYQPTAGQGYPGQAVPQSGNTVEISVSCTNLKDQDLMSKSDPVCILFEKHSGVWKETGRTEMIEDCHHPKWQKKFILINNSHTSQDLKFEVYDWDSKSQKLNKHDILGQIEVSLGTLLSSPGKQLTASLKKGGGGRISIMAEQINQNARERIRIQLAAQKLDKKDTFGKSDPYFQMSKKMPNGQWSLVYKSEVIKNNCNPKWSPMDKPISELCNGDYDRQLKIEVFDYDSSGENDIIGELTTNLRSLSAGVKNHSQYEVINPKKQRNKRSYKNSGTLSVTQFNSQ